MTAARRATIQRSATYFPVPNVATTAEYYGDVLGFRRDYAAGEPMEFAICSRGGCALMFRRAANGIAIVPNEQQGGTWDVFCWVDDLDALYDEVASKGVAVVYPPTVQPYGMREFAVRDINGYVLGFGEAIAGQ